MKDSEFNRYINQQIERCQKILSHKSTLYASDVDRLHNFDVASTLWGSNQIMALGGMLSKHTVRLFDMIQAPNEVSIHDWDETITDHLNYLLILSAIIHATYFETPDTETPVQDTGALESKKEWAINPYPDTQKFHKMENN